MTTIILNILIMSVVVFAVSNLLPGIRLKNFGTAIVVAIVYSLVSFFIGWLLTLLALPLILITLGLFTFIINAVLLYITDALIDDFEIEGFGTTILAAVLITLGNLLLRWILY